MGNIETLKLRNFEAKKPRNFESKRNFALEKGWGQAACSQPGELWEIRSDKFLFDEIRKIPKDYQKLEVHAKHLEIWSVLCDGHLLTNPLGLECWTSLGPCRGTSLGPCRGLFSDMNDR